MMQRKSQLGFSVVELMIGISIGLMLVLLVLGVSDNGRESYRRSDAQGQIQDNGRFAMYNIAQSIRSAGFIGCAGDINQITNNLNSSGAGYNAALMAFNGPGIIGSDNLSGATGEVAGTDSITLSTPDVTQTALNVLSPYSPNGNGSLKVSTPNNITQGSIVLVTDCTSGDIFQVTNNNTSTSGNIAHGSGGSPGNSSSSLSKAYSGGSYVYNLNPTTYSIRTGANGDPSLFTTTIAGAMELVPEIENLQLNYGEDMDGDGVANRYVTANNVTNWSNVVSVQVSLVARSQDDNLVPAPQPYLFNGSTITPTDKRMRRVFTTVVTLRNKLLG